jgi:hypothetical protein
MSMPLDGSYLANEPYRIIEVPNQPISVPDQPISIAQPQPRRSKIKWSRIGVVGFALWLIAWGSEVHFPDRGIFTLLFGGPTLLRENDIARSILYGRDAHRLEFTVAGQHYAVISPGHPLTPEDQAALLNYASRNNFPMWTVDGQFAVDP